MRQEERARATLSGCLHYLPGRVRFAVPDLLYNERLARRLEAHLAAVPGVLGVTASARSGNILVKHDPAVLTLAQLALAIAGVDVPPPPNPAPDPAAALTAPAPNRPQPGERRPGPYGPRLLVGGGLLALLLGKRLFNSRFPWAGSRRVFNLAAAVTIASGYPLLRRGLAAATRGRLNTDLVLSGAGLLLLAARESLMGLSVMLLVNLNHFWRERLVSRSGQAVREIAESTGQQAWLSLNGTQVAVSPAEVRPGQVVVVHTGEPVPVDGLVVQGTALLYQGGLTGESFPVGRKANDQVLAGSLVKEGTLWVQAQRVGPDTALAQMARQVAAGPAQEPTEPGAFTEPLLYWSLAVAGLALWSSGAWQRSLAVLLAGAPAAMELALPSILARTSARAAEKGIFIKDTRHLENLAGVDTLLFDKTGTLTRGEPTVESIVSLSENYQPRQVLTLATAAEGQAEHPVALALRRQAWAEHITTPGASAQKVYTRGVQAQVNSQTVIVGNQQVMRSHKIKTITARAKATRLRHQGERVLYVAADGKLIGLIGLRDTLKPFSHEAVEMVRARGVARLGLVTGDNQELARQVAAELHLDEGRGDMEPQDKARLVKQLGGQGRTVALVGDGINDALAMRSARVGIAFGAGGSAPAMQAAGIVIAGEDPRRVPETLRLAQIARYTGRQNRQFVAGMNTAGLALAFAGLLSPAGAALWQNAITLGVLLNSSRARLDEHPAPRRLAKTRPKKAPKRLSALQAAAAEPALHPVSLAATAEPALHPAGPPPIPWHVMETAEVLTGLKTSPGAGLAAAEARQRLERFGPNQLAAEKRGGFLASLAGQFKDFTVQVLLGATGVSLFLGKTGDAAAIIAIVLANAILGALQERKAEKSLAALKDLNAPAARVMREGQRRQIPAAQLVPGDIVLLESGDRVPADARVILSHNLEAEESALTGEALPVAKTAAPCSESEIDLGDRSSMVYMGASITRGRGVAVVVGTGMATEMGAIAGLLQQAQPEKTPLERQMARLGKRLVGYSLAAAGLVGLGGILWGKPPLEMFLTGVSLAVAAIPEGLPALVTVALASGVQRMARANAVVRRLAAVETMGCATVICTDKTGTLTQNRMVVTRVYCGGRTWQVSGEGYRPEGTFLADGSAADPLTDADLAGLITAGVVCNHAALQPSGPAARREWRIIGDPTEGALLTLAAKAGLWPETVKKRFEPLAELPFEAERARMTVACCDERGRYLVCTKGAPDHILEYCTGELRGGEAIELDHPRRQEIQRVCEAMTGHGLRVLAVAYKYISELPSNLAALEEDLTLAGLVGIEDPPRPEVAAAITRCHRAGIRVIMITGDHPHTAAAIGRQLGLLRPQDAVLTGRELAAMSPPQFRQAVSAAPAFARVTPRQKLEIVRALKSQGQVVVMTGDGVNDAPAVKEADIGIAMGKSGTDVTREASSLVLTDDNFASIVAAVEQGRGVYANIRGSLAYLLSTNAGEIILMLITSLAGMPLPLLPAQLLWLNLLTDGLPALAQGVQHPGPGVMRLPPRNPGEDLVSRGLGQRTILQGGLLGLASLGVFRWGLATGNTARARTMALAALTGSQLLYAVNRQKNLSPDEASAKNPYLSGALALSAGLLLAAIYVPGLSRVLSTTSLGLGDWLGVGLATFLAGGIDRLVVAGAGAKPV